MDIKKNLKNLKKKIIGKKDPVKEKKKDTSMVHQSKNKKSIQLNDVNTLIETAVKSKAGVEQLKELMKMKYEHEAREAKKEFHIAFSKMQADLPVIIKDKSVYTESKTLMYHYSSLEQMVEQVKPVMGNHGFSYCWSEEFPDAGKKRVFFHVTGYNHTEFCFIDIPIMAANKYVNSIQQAGSSSTYGRRYTMMNMLGLVCDEDDDGRGTTTHKQEPPKKEELKKVDESKAEPSPPPPEQLKQATKNNLVNEILALCQEAGCKTVEDAQSLTGFMDIRSKDVTVKNLEKAKKQILSIIEKRKKNL